MSHSRSPAELVAGIIAHKAAHGKDAELIMIRDTYRELYSFYFRDKLYTLCCGRGMLFNGIPAIITPSPFVETFLICY
jgi:hypothetical protein